MLVTAAEGRNRWVGVRSRRPRFEGSERGDRAEREARSSASCISILARVQESKRKDRTACQNCNDSCDGGWRASRRGEQHVRACSVCSSAPVKARDRATVGRAPFACLESFSPGYSRCSGLSSALLLMGVVLVLGFELACSRSQEYPRKSSKNLRVHACRGASSPSTYTSLGRSSTHSGGYT